MKDMKMRTNKYNIREHTNSEELFALREARLHQPIKPFREEGSDGVHGFQLIEADGSPAILITGADMVGALTSGMQLLGGFMGLIDIISEVSMNEGLYYLNRPELLRPLGGLLYDVGMEKTIELLREALENVDPADLLP